MSSDSKPEDQGGRWVTPTAIIIAIITVIAAVVTWRASVSDDAAGDEDFAGVQATIDAEQVKAINFVNAMEHYGAYTNYRRYKSMSDAFEKAAKRYPKEEDYFERAGVEAADLAVANLGQFPVKYMTRQGTYSVHRDLGAMWADAARKRDLDGESHYQQADLFRNKTLRLSLAVVVLSLSLVVLTLVESVPEAVQVATLGLGSLIGIAGTIWAVLIEVGK